MCQCKCAETRKRKKNEVKKNCAGSRNRCRRTNIISELMTNLVLCFAPYKIFELFESSPLKRLLLRVADPCFQLNCAVNAECVISSGSGTCICDDGFRGNPNELCERK